MTVVRETLLEAEEKMEKVLAACHSDLIDLGTGRAFARCFARIVVDDDGTMTPIPQLASVIIPAAQVATIRPLDARFVAPVVRAIRDTDLGVDPVSDGSTIRVVFPQLTAKRHRDLVQVAATWGEDTKASVRSLSWLASEVIAKLSKQGKVAEKDAPDAEAELQALTKKYVASIDELVRHTFGQ